MNTKDFVKQKLLKLLDDPKQFGSYTENDNITHLESRYYGNYKFIICCNKYYQDRNTSRASDRFLFLFTKYTLFFKNTNNGKFSFKIKIRTFSFNKKNNFIYKKIENLLNIANKKLEYDKTKSFISSLPEEDQQEYIRINKLERILD